MSKVKVTDQFASDRLMQQVKYQQRRIDEPLPTPRQVAMVLHALADHTAIMSAIEHRRDNTSPWPEALSVGRWFHDVGNDLECIEQKSVLQPTVKVKAEQPLQVNSKSHRYTEKHQR